MTWAIDSSTPAVGTNSTTGNLTSVSTPSFTPPANALIVAGFFIDNHVQPTVSGGGLTWHRLTTNYNQASNNYCCAEIWVADTGSSPGSMSITATFASTFIGDTSFVTLGIGVCPGLKAAASQLGQTAYNYNYGSSNPTCTISSLSGAGSMVVAVGGVHQAGVTPTPGSGQSLTWNGYSSLTRGSSGSDTFWFQYLTSTSLGSGTSATINDTLSSQSWVMLMAELLASSGSSVTVNAVAAQVRARGTVPSVALGKTITAPSAQVRVRAGAPAVLSASSALGAVSAQVRVRTGTPSLTISHTGTMVAAQVRVRASHPTLSISPTVHAASAQIRVRATAPTLTRSSTLKPSSAQVRLRAGVPTVTATHGVTINATSAQIRVRTSIQAFSAFSTIQAVSAQIRVRAISPSISASSTLGAVSAQVRLRGGVASLRVSYTAVPLAAQVRVRAGTPTISASSTLVGTTAQIRVRAGIPSLSGATASYGTLTGGVIPKTALGGSAPIARTFLTSGVEVI